MKKGVEILWSPNLAYAIGLLTTDGCLSSDGRHIDMSSIDLEQLENFSLCFGKSYKITSKKSGSGKISLRIQFSDVFLYRFLQKVGLTPHKSRTIEAVDLPEEYFFDFLRGHFDGDGTFYTYKDKRWKNSQMFYLCFVSSSEKHIVWIRQMIKSLTGIKGSLTKARNNSTYQLKYAKKESVVLIGKLYYNQSVVSLSRKRIKIEETLRTFG